MMKYDFKAENFQLIQLVLENLHTHFKNALQKFGKKDIFRQINIHI